MMKIYIPSRQRSSRSFLEGAHSTMRWIRGTALEKRTIYCVRSDEVKAYKAALSGTKVQVMDVGLAKNLGEKRDFIARHVEACGEKKFMMSDDDCLIYVRKSPDQFNLRYTEPEESVYLIDRMEELLDKYAMVGVSAREGNNRAGNGTFEELILECLRSMRMYAFNTKDYLSIEPNRLTEMADFDTTLQLLRKGRKNAVIFYYAQGQASSNYPGGCSIYRTPATHDAVCRQLAQLHPDFVRLRQKVNKGYQGGFGTRTEVTCAWKKAYESSQRLRKSA